ncbi:MAG: xanthine dehydrogenase family protein molybdopterin-binding subunit [Acidobacteriota bacterium]
MNYFDKDAQKSPFKVSRRGVLQAGLGLGASGLVLGFRPGRTLAKPSSAATDAQPAFAPNLFVEIEETGKVRLIVHRTEMGQGVRTSLPMMLADELEVDIDQVELVQAVGDKKYGNQNTDGSTSIRLNWEPLRQAGAAAREMLVQAAAKKWGVAADQCRAEQGKVIGPDGELTYGELAVLAAREEVPDKPKLKDPSDYRYIGKKVAGLDVPDMVQGKSTYGMDVRLPGMVYASIERSPTIAGKLGSFDPAPAMAVRGVQKVLTLEARSQPMNTNASVAVVADSTWNAMEGRKALEIEWDSGGKTLESSDDYRAKLEALVDGEGNAVRSEGDWAAARDGAAKVLEARYHGPYLVHAPMEPLAATALVKDGKCELWVPAQDPQTARQRVAALLDMPLENVTVNVTFLGGGFGRKSKPDFIIEAASIAQQLEGTPVKLVWSREDEVKHGFYRAQNMQKLQAAVDGEGGLVGWRHHTAFPTIISTFMAGAKDPNPFEVGMGATNLPYAVPNVQVEASGLTSDLRIGWLRSVCNTFHAHAVNCFMDELAEDAGKDPVDYRLAMLGEDRKLKFSPREDPYPLETARLRRVIERTAENASWGSKLADGMGHGFAAHFSFLSYVGMALKASVEEGKVKVHEVDCVLDCGTAISPDSVVAQMEGAVAFGLSMALYGEITVRDGVVRQSNFHNYPMLRINEMPKVNVEILQTGNPPSGVGEPGVPPVAPALANALYPVTGKRFRDLPIAPQLKA